MINQKYMELSNPVVVTGKGCLNVLADTGDVSAIKYKQALQIPDDSVPDQMKPLVPYFAIANEARFRIMNQLVLKLHKNTVLDIPCGYVPRAVYVADAGMRYVGGDLPTVANDMKTVIDSVLTPEQAALVRYCTVDATNYDSLRQAVRDAKGEICVSTEGLLGYFTNSELEEMCGAIHALLTEFGGCWATCDVDASMLYGVTFATLLDPSVAFNIQKAMQNATNTSENFVTTTLIAGTQEEKLAFMQSQGFDVQKISFADMLPDLNSLKDRPEDMVRYRQACSQMNLWVMTVKSDSKLLSENTSVKKPFSIISDLKGENLHIHLTGRVDSITAPELLEFYKKQMEQNHITSADLDVKQMEYISSAGLRVLLIMFKELHGAVRLHHITKNVQEILDTTGFSEFFAE